MEALRIRPLVDHHDLALAAVEAMGDDPVLLRALGDAAKHVPVLTSELFELVRIPSDAERHDDRHVISSFGSGRRILPAGVQACCGWSARRRVVTRGVQPSQSAAPTIATRPTIPAKRNASSVPPTSQ